MRAATKIDWRSHLNAEERSVIEATVKIAREEFSDEINTIIFYGSKVRGDCHEESDLDLLVIFNSPDRKLWHKAYFRLMDANPGYNAELSIKMGDEKWFDYLRDMRAPFWQEINKDGVVLWRR